MNNINKSIWIIRKAIKFCWRYIFVNIAILLTSTIIGLAINVINKNIINELIRNTSLGEVSSVFIGLVIE